MIAVAVHFFRFAPICLRTLGTIRSLVESCFASDALVMLTAPLATREMLAGREMLTGSEMFTDPIARTINSRTNGGYLSYQYIPSYFRTNTYLHTNHALVLIITAKHDYCKTRPRPQLT